MRNPTRIGELLILIQLIWEKQPDTRFNQLVHNLQYEYARENNFLKTIWEKDEYRGIVSYQKYEIADLFNVEDDKFITFLQKKLVDSHKK